MAAAVAAVMAGGVAAGDVDALGQQYPPGAVEAAFAEAAATVPSLRPEMREALRAAVGGWGLGGREGGGVGAGGCGRVLPACGHVVRSDKGEGAGPLDSRQGGWHAGSALF